MAQLTGESSQDAAISAAQTPSIAAAFLVKFDNRKGYTVTWHKSLDNVKVEGEVEYKALPSGLHNVEEDLVYFILENHVGISAFLRKAGNANERNARMIAVGTLIPLEYGRMGKSWLHAGKLKELARNQIENPDDYTQLNKYWEENKLNDGEFSGSSNDEEPPNGYLKTRALSTGSLSIPAHILAPHHPALALTNLLDTFGPLIFPLFRAGLQRKRILIAGETPVELTCDFVYNISVISSLSKSAASVVPIDDPANLRLQALFNVGVADVMMLMDLKSPWIACTTDDVLCTKPKLFDLLVILPSVAARKGPNKSYPKLILSSPELVGTFPKFGIRATQRDARRYMTLRKGLHSLPSSLHQVSDQDQTNDDEDDARSTTSSVSTIPAKHEAVEPLSWSLMAYTSLVWWASAGDRRSGLMEAEEGEDDQDITLLRGDGLEDGQTKEVAIVSYFHRWSSLIFSAMSQAVQRASTTERYQDEEEEDVNDENDDEPRGNEGDDNEQSDGEEGRELLVHTINDDDVVEVTEDDVRLMGLDVWSDSDKEFIEEMIEYWWARRAVVQGGTVECCGMRVL